MATSQLGPTVVRLNIIGSLELVREPDGLVELPGGVRVRQVLALFAVKDQYARQELVDILWPGETLNDDDPVERRRIKDKLDRALSDARKAMGLDRQATALVTRQEVVYRTRGGHVAITSDLEQFRELAGSDDAMDWQRALALVRGPIAHYLPVKGIRTDWLDRQRQAQERELKEMLARLDRDASAATLEQRCQDVLDGRRENRRLQRDTGEARKAQPSDEPGENSTATERDPEPPTLVSASGAHTRVTRLRPSSTNARFAVGALVCVAVLGVITLALRSTAHRASRPPRGAIVNTWTGQWVTRTSKTKPTASGMAQISGGATLRACNISAGLPCTYLPNSTSLTARRGDIIEFRQRLYNPMNIPIPYLKMNAYWGPVHGKHETEAIGLEVLIQWPRYPDGVEYSTSSPIEDTIRLPAPSAYHLVYVPNSTIMTSPYDPSLSYHLPDGIMTGGLALANVGSPPSCFQCAAEYTRTVSFRAKVE